MPQLSLYLNETDYNEILKQAKLANMSISKWAVKKIFESKNFAFPNGYEKLCGSFSDEELQEQRKMPPKFEGRRERF